jgi:hypothetical protein
MKDASSDRQRLDVSTMQDDHLASAASDSAELNAMLRLCSLHRTHLSQQRTLQHVCKHRALHLGLITHKLATEET